MPTFAHGLETWALGAIVIWFITWLSVRREPTTHGQDVLVQWGCLLGFVWPLFLVYLVFMSPFIAWTYWQDRKNKRT